MLTNRLQRHLRYLREIWNMYQKKKYSRNFKNPTKFWISEKNWNSRFQNFEKIDSIVLPNRSNRSNRKKSLNRLERFIGQRINSQYQDYGFVRAKWQRNVASKNRFLSNVWKEPRRGCGFVTFVTFLRFFDVLGFARKNKKITYRVTKT